MGQWWIWLFGAAMWITIICVIRFGRQPDRSGDCPECGHEAGLDGKRCAAIDEASGLASAPCFCQNDYHWNYESVAG